MNNIIRAAFQESGDNIKAYGLYQWDYGQKMEIHGLDLPPAVEVHFAATGDTEALVRIGFTRDKVTTVAIPETLLEQKNDIRAYIYISDAEHGETIKTINLPMNARPKPEAWNDSEETTMGVLMEAINQFAAGRADGIKYENSVLQLMSGEEELARVTITGGAGGGDGAREIELQKSETAIQWRHVGDQEWADLVLLADLCGEPGTDGSPGKDGSDGQPGKNGTDGITPHIGDNGNWYIGDTDTGRPSRGEAGTDGAPGKDGQDGTDGADGQDGAPGANGEDGRGIISVTIKTDGHLQIDYSDGTNADVGKVVGTDGLDGASGIPVRQEMTAEDTVAELHPGKLYIFPEMAELTLTLAEPADTGIANEYHVIFQSGATATILSIPDAINVPAGFSVDANKIYELSIMEGCMLAQSWEVQAGA